MKTNFSSLPFLFFLSIPLPLSSIFHFLSLDLSLSLSLSACVSLSYIPYTFAHILLISPSLFQSSSPTLPHLSQRRFFLLFGDPIFHLFLCFFLNLFLYLFLSLGSVSSLLDAVFGIFTGTLCSCFTSFKK